MWVGNYFRGLMMGLSLMDGIALVFFHFFFPPLCTVTIDTHSLVISVLIGE